MLKYDTQQQLLQLSQSPHYSTSEEADITGSKCLDDPGIIIHFVYDSRDCLLIFPN